MIKVIDSIGDLNNDNCDVEVTIGETKYVLTLFTIQNIQQLMKSYVTTGECLNGSFFAASNLVIVKDLNTNTIENSINELIRSNELGTYFKST